MQPQINLKTHISLTYETEMMYKDIMVGIEGSSSEIKYCN